MVRNCFSCATDKFLTVFCSYADKLYHTYMVRREQSGDRDAAVCPRATSLPRMNITGVLSFAVSHKSYETRRSAWPRLTLRQHPWTPQRPCPRYSRLIRWQSV